MKFHAALVAGALVVCTTAAARATDLTCHMTADNVFQAYLSTDDSVLGTLIGSGFWQDPPAGAETFTVTLTPGVPQFLHIVATDTGPAGPGQPHAMIFGEFTLSDNGFSFGNSSQYLLTGTDHWSVSKTGFNLDYVPPTDLGGNSGDNQPWGDRWTYPSEGHFIWSDTQSTGYEEQDWSTAYFSTPLIPNNGNTPEPTTLALLALGGVPLLLKRRRHA